jgi:lysyl-tRNA synthetase class I
MSETLTEKIICPECNTVQVATIEKTLPFWTYIHNCECGHIIMESEWQEAK